MRAMPKLLHFAAPGHLNPTANAHPLKFSNGRRFPRFRFHPTIETGLFYPGDRIFIYLGQVSFSITGNILIPIDIFWKSLNIASQYARSMTLPIAST
jgi:hypothetical protein